jgi:hypothetical protein
MKENNNLEQHFRELKHLEAGPPDGAKGSIEKRLVDSGMLKNNDERGGGLWMVMLLLLVVITPLVIMVTKSKPAKPEIIAVAFETATMNNDFNSSYGIEDKKNEAESFSSVGNIKPEVENENNEKRISENGKKITTKKWTGVTNNKSEKNEAIARLKRMSEKKNRDITERVLVAKASDDTKEKKQDVHEKLSAVNAHAKAKEGILNSPEVIDVKHEGTEETKKEISAGEGWNDNATAMLGTDLPVLNQDVADVELSLAVEEEKPVDKEPLEELKNKPVINSTIKEKSPPIIPEQIRPVFAFDFSGAPQFNTIKYGNGAYNYKSYIEESRQSEKETPSFTAAFGIVVSFNSFVMEMGMRHSALSSDFSYAETYHQTDSLGNVITGQTHYLATNKISFLELPLLIGCRFHFDRFEMELKTGVMTSFITSANTTIFSLNTGNVVKYDELADSPYRKNHWSAIGALNMLYPITDRVMVFVQPSMKYGLNSIFKDNYSVTKKIQGVTLALGLRVKL